MRRHWTLIRGPRARCEAQAKALVGQIETLWISPGGRAGSLTPRQARGALGGEVDAVVLDLHAGLDPDLLALSQGFIRGGGRLILLLPEAPVPMPALEALPAPTTRLWERLGLLEEDATSAPLQPVPFHPTATRDQDRAVETLERLWAGPPSASVLLARRGRGKSAALGRALGQRPALVSSGNPDSTRELFRFATGQPLPDARFVPLGALLSGPPPPLLVLDEAARIPVHLLRAIVTRFPDTHLAFATTTQGYEGTGGGFVLRFLRWLERTRETTRLSLDTPIRWDPGDPLEAALDRVLLLDEPLAPLSGGPLVHEHLDRARLDETTLRDTFALLTHAHYRTTPGDLHRLLDAPGVELHVLRQGGRVVAANWLSWEGGLSPARCEALSAGQGRLRGHALADSLVAHCSRPEAGTWRLLRSVRIAVHPELQGQGAGARLAEAVHQTHQPEAFGTLFGATPHVLRFRRRQGYRLVRLGSSRGERSGEPSVGMVKPCTERAERLVSELQHELARSLPDQLALQGDLPLDPLLTDALFESLPAPTPWPEQELQRVVRGYLSGARTVDSARSALRVALAGQTLDAPEDRVVRARVLDGLCWDEAARQADLPHVRAAQRALRRRLRQLL